jgi:hypothetical protein
MKAKRISLLSKEALRELKEEKFSGKIYVSLENGIINDLDFNELE